MVFKLFTTIYWLLTYCFDKLTKNFIWSVSKTYFVVKKKNSKSIKYYKLRQKSFSKYVRYFKVLQVFQSVKRTYCNKTPPISKCDSHFKLLQYRGILVQSGWNILSIFIVANNFQAWLALRETCPHLEVFWFFTSRILTESMR